MQVFCISYVTKGYCKCGFQDGMQEKEIVPKVGTYRFLATTIHSL